MTAKTLAERSASYRQRKAERVARMEAALISLCVAADAVQDVSGGTPQHSALWKATEAALKAVARR